MFEPGAERGFNIASEIRRFRSAIAHCETVPQALEKLGASNITAAILPKLGVTIEMDWRALHDTHHYCVYSSCDTEKNDQSLLSGMRESLLDLHSKGVITMQVPLILQYVSEIYRPFFMFMQNSSGRVVLNIRAQSRMQDDGYAIPHVDDRFNISATPRLVLTLAANATETTGELGTVLYSRRAFDPALLPPYSALLCDELRLYSERMPKAARDSHREVARQLGTMEWLRSIGVNPQLYRQISSLIPIILKRGAGGIPHSSNVPSLLEAPAKRILLIMNTLEEKNSDST